ncbi:hypothetical protein [Myceligenerans xiligouense]|uniref:Polyketide cyclase/dehydrase/lipid transport protein n=1 Tax=Myceligenerans xiligouense TaxID=253184 RepID=A0A3N4YQL0_9MICO|nr:hypothetical protein [Myceligenerans xiligouense]RPF20770.1 hypothetical protein EDD34_1375 [Myceligenerans xiligouense]
MIRSDRRGGPARSGSPRRRSRRLLGALVGVACAGVYGGWVKPRHDRWGATDDEVVAVLPGDDHLREPATQFTRAITIDVPPCNVWPWVVQIGADRGGFYSYEWLENLFGLGIRNARDIVAEWQDLHVGDLVRASRDRGGGWYVVELRPDEAMVLRVADAAAGRPVRRDEPAGGEFLWTFALRDTQDGRTRLLLRERSVFRAWLLKSLMVPVTEISFLMSRRMLLGIKASAEGRVAVAGGR